jgi:catechol 2,3-dioxygenase-like lactoylglutathione lyase family enzyme
MSIKAIGFHHVGLITRDMNKTIARYEQLGFCFTPRSQPRISLAPGKPPEPFGAGNRTAIFEENYLEVLGYTDVDLWNSTTAEQRGPYNLDIPLARYEGMHVVHFASDDLSGLRERLVSQGVECGEIKPFERNVDTPDGEQLMKALALSFPHRANPEGLVQMAQHLTPELVLRLRFMKHPNGARLVTESIICAADPERYAAKYARYTGCSYKCVDGHFRVDAGGGARVTVVSPQRVSEIVPGGNAPAEPSMIGFAVAVTDVDGVGELLKKNRVPFREFDRFGALSSQLPTLVAVPCCSRLDLDHATANGTTRHRICRYKRSSGWS